MPLWKGDEREKYRVIEHIAAGKVPVKELVPGTAAKIMTGAPVPKGAGRVVMLEDTGRGNEIVHVFQSSKRNEYLPAGI